MNDDVSKTRVVLALVAPFLVAICAFAIGINWGLPSRADDEFLFASREPWTGAEIIALTGGWDAAGQASDHDVNPLANRDAPVVVNATDAQRAEIVQRYRLYSHQPDEMLTLRALGQMRPGQMQLDPRMYQYGGLWVYPIGALLKFGEEMGLLTVRGDVAHYLDHPEQFGRFYIVMRAYSALWGLAGVAAVMLILRKMSGSLLTVSLGGIAFACMPVVVNMAHEGKPHLAGAVLLLWTSLAAAAYVRNGSSRRAIAAGALWGAATGMVLLSLPGIVILLLMIALRPQSLMRRVGHLVLALGAGALVYGISNPYVVMNAMQGSSVLSSNMTAHGNFYQVGQVVRGLFNGIDLLAEGSSLAVAVIGGIAAVVGVLRMARTPGAAVDFPRKALAILLAAPALLVLAQFVLLGAGKPGEYGRFAILPCVALLIAALGGLRNWIKLPRTRRIAGIALVAWVVAAGAIYIKNFARDTGRSDTRTEAARTLEMWADRGRTRMAIFDEPAPYSMPPVDLFCWVLLLQPVDRPVPPAVAEFDAIVKAVDRLNEPPTEFVSWSPDAAIQLLPSRISWANKPIDLFVPSNVSDRETN
ncbi:MAG TPA: hypothetical protein VGN72_04480 [Tepidisphaeraceae bacterium]|jgi:hypothetical protein|nr:hypothetical protein [Tepidisphaeraceae bacterium]